MIVKWKAHKSGWRDYIIDRIECIRETEASVWIAERGRESRAAKETDCVKYHDTWDAAHEWTVLLASNEVARCETALVRATDRLAKVRAVHRPADADSPATA